MKTIKEANDRIVRILKSIVKRTESHAISQRVREGFDSWFQNRMMVVFAVIQFPKERNLSKLQGITDFLHALEHHFTVMNKTAELKDAYDYLRSYFQSYPSVSSEDSEEALKMVDRIYGAMGLKRVTQDWGQRRSCVITTMEEAADKVSVTVKGCILHIVERIRIPESIGHNQINQNYLVKS